MVIVCVRKVDGGCWQVTNNIVWIHTVNVRIQIRCRLYKVLSICWPAFALTKSSFKLYHIKLLYIIHWIIITVVFASPIFCNIYLYIYYFSTIWRFQRDAQKPSIKHICGSIILLVYISILVRHQKVAFDPWARDGVTNKLQKYVLQKHLNTINMSANILLFVYICIFVRHHIISMLWLRSSYPV